MTIRAKKLRKKRCIFCGNSGSKLIYCESEDKWIHRICLFYAVSEQSFHDMYDVADRMAYLLISGMDVDKIEGIYDGEW